MVAEDTSVQEPQRFGTLFQLRVPFRNLVTYSLTLEKLFTSTWQAGDTVSYISVHQVVLLTQFILNRCQDFGSFIQGLITRLFSGYQHTQRIRHLRQSCYINLRIPYHTVPQPRQSAYVVCYVMSCLSSTRSTITFIHSQHRCLVRLSCSTDVSEQCRLPLLYQVYYCTLSFYVFAVTILLPVSSFQHTSNSLLKHFMNAFIL